MLPFFVKIVALSCSGVKCDAAAVVDLSGNVTCKMLNTFQKSKIFNAIQKIKIFNTIKKNKIFNTIQKIKMFSTTVYTKAPEVLKLCIFGKLFCAH